MIDPVYYEYRRVLAEQIKLPAAKWTFKSDPYYRQILEHVNRDQGEQYIDCIRRDFPVEWEKFKGIFLGVIADNDNLGAPEKFRFEELGIECSPTSLRYLQHALLTWQQIILSGITYVHVIEIGGGYGGLALFMSRLAAIYKCILRSYTIVDIPEAGEMQAAYTHALAVPVRIVDGEDDTAIARMIEATARNDRFLVSAYGYSEFSEPIRDHYKDAIVAHCPHGLLVWNSFPFKDFTPVRVTVQDERPLTGMHNLLVTF